METPSGIVSRPKRFLVDSIGPKIKGADGVEAPKEVSFEVYMGGSTDGVISYLSEGAETCRKRPGRAVQ